MDQDRLDHLARSLATRRGALRGLAGGALAAALGRLGLEGAAAACLKVGKSCPHDDACCAGSTCEGTGRCARNGQPTGNCRCRCKAGLNNCGGRCRNTQTDEKNCGGCGATDPKFVCAEGETCRAGSCEPDCAKDCAGKTCGSDGCGGSCGTCEGDLVCSDPARGGVCQCAGPTCGGACCAADQRCVGGACWPDDEERAFVALIANYREGKGLPALALQDQLGAAAELHSQDQAANNFSSHTGSDGSSPDQRIARAGYAFSWWGENIYWGGATANEAFAWWKGSPDHNAIMLSTNFTQLGIGRARSDAGVWYWTTTFGRPS